jgi:hypothetical protein
MKNKVLYKVFIWTFILLYLGTAFISYCHSIEFFNIGNSEWMSYILGIIFELGQATVLASLLLTNNRKNLLPWCLIILLTAVQVIGNTYSVYKYIALSESDYYMYLSNALLFWINGISQETIMVIVSWIIGAMLPIVALAMTSMVTTQMKLQSTEEVINIPQEIAKEEDIKEEKPIIEETPIKEKEVVKNNENDTQIKHRIKSVENKQIYNRHN